MSKLQDINYTISVKDMDIYKSVLSLLEDIISDERISEEIRQEYYEAARKIGGIDNEQSDSETESIC